MAKLNIVYNRHCGKAASAYMPLFDTKQAQITHSFHSTFEGYAPTPLAKLENTAKHLGTGSIFVKDESHRFGLNAFKALGGSFCLGSYIADRLGRDISALSYSELTSEKTKSAIGEITFVTATDGNHGRGIAWTAAKLGQQAVVYMPKGSAAERLENIRKLGAKADITDVNYDDTVRFAKQQAEANGWVLVQDTAWEGYEKIPTRIMQGYLTMALEAVNQLDGKKPTHIFLQAGVGAMAGALAAFFRDVYGFEPKIVIVEPDKADCFYQTAKADDGSIHSVGGALDTIMAGLACGEPCTIGWDLLRHCADAFVSMDDTVAANGMRMLACPAQSDDPVTSGESGAAGFGAVAEIMRNYPQIKANLGIDRNSTVLCFSTEGATDVENYRNIVWYGKYSDK
ncbi:MAG: diaminopropionate ammonia-lyase [Oscillospiraceae bacterium]|nr:diaminopropionate ammonia-lyase [Oscillospiraceae bacterium]